MIEILVIGLLTLFGVAVAVGTLIVLPLVIVAAVLKLLFVVVLLPFRLLGFVFSLGFGLFVGAGKLVLGLAGALFGLLLLVATVIAIPLVPLVMLGVGLWFVIRMLRPRPAVA